jgi:superfamily II DNA helicase RecQ
MMSSARRLCATTLCIRCVILEYLEDENVLAGQKPIFTTVRCCTNCARPASDAKVNLGFELAWLLETISRHQGSRPISLSLLVDTLCGSRKQSVVQAAPQRFLSEIIGKGKHKKQQWWYDFALGPVLDGKFLSPVAGKGGTYGLTAAGEAFLKAHPVRSDSHVRRG